MSRLSDDFLSFLLDLHKQTGQNSFRLDEYKGFTGYERAVAELYNRGLIEIYNDILGTISIKLPD